MKFEIGKVKDYDGFTGCISAPSGNFEFFKNDINDSNDININDYVLFRGEVINNIHRAYFVRFFAKDVTDVINNKARLERLLKKEGGNV